MESDCATNLLLLLVNRGTPDSVLDLAPIFYMSVLAYMDYFWWIESSGGSSSTLTYSVLLQSSDKLLRLLYRLCILSAQWCCVNHLIGRVTRCDDRKRRLSRLRLWLIQARSDLTAKRNAVMILENPDCISTKSWTLDEMSYSHRALVQLSILMGTVCSHH
jgi:hypothetical protein